MYFKILMDSVIVDALHDPTYVRWQEKNGIFIIARNIAKACGVVSSDGSTIYHANGLPDIPIEGYTTVSMVEITEDEYLIIREQLDTGNEPVIPETPDENVDGDTQEQQVLTLASLHARLTATESEVAGITSAIEKGLSL